MHTPLHERLPACEGIGRRYDVYDPDTGTSVMLTEYTPTERWPTHEWSLLSLTTPVENRRKGGATRVMQEVIELAGDITVTLGVGGGDPRHGEMTTEQLLTFYKKFGFTITSMGGAYPRMHRL